MEAYLHDARPVPVLLKELGFRRLRRGRGVSREGLGVIGVWLTSSINKMLRWLKRPIRAWLVAKSTPEQASSSARFAPLCSLYQVLYKNFLGGYHVCMGAAVINRFEVFTNAAING